MKNTSRSRATIRYAFDEANRLMVREQDRASSQLRSIQIVDGTITIDSKNRLIYEAASPMSAGTDGPRSIKLDGAWSLTPNHELALTLHGSGRDERQTLFLKGSLIEAKASALVFALRREESGNLREADQVSLSGRWQADAQNRLSFLIERADGSEDRLTLQGGWELGAHHELLYRYQQKRGARRVAEAHTLAFDGAWDVTASDRLVYRLSGSDDSSFEFRAALQSPSLLARAGRLVYQIGIGVAGGRRRQRRVTLFGAWKLNRDLSVSFEVPYADGRIQAIRFEGEAQLTARDRIAVELSSHRREKIGLTVTFTKELAPDASLFLRLRKDAEETEALGGVRVRF